MGSSERFFGWSTTSKEVIVLAEEAKERRPIIAPLQHRHGHRPRKGSRNREIDGTESGDTDATESDDAYSYDTERNDADCKNDTS